MKVILNSDIRKFYKVDNLRLVKSYWDTVSNYQEYGNLSKYECARNFKKKQDRFFKLVLEYLRYTKEEEI